MNCTKYLSLASFLITSSLGLNISASRADQWSNAGFENAVLTQVSLDPYYQTAPAVPFAYGLKLTSVILRKTGWTEAEVIDRTQSMATALAQCGVKITGFRIITADPPQGIVRFDGQVKRSPNNSMIQIKKKRSSPDFGQSMIALHSSMFSQSPMTLPTQT